MCYGFCRGCWRTEYDPQTECDPLCLCISCYWRSQRTPALSSIQQQPRSRGLWCGNEASGHLTTTVLFLRVASLVPTRTRLAFCIDQPLLIPSKESFVLLLQLSSNLVP
ncbi:unnamed protein product [Arctogadus glacialis]